MSNDKIIWGLRFFYILSFIFDLTIIGTILGVPLFLVLWAIQYIFLAQANPVRVIRCDVDKNPKLFRLIQTIHNVFYSICIIVFSFYVLFFSYYYFDTRDREITLTEDLKLHTPYFVFEFPRGTSKTPYVSGAFYDAFVDFKSKTIEEYPTYENYYFFRVIFESYTDKLNKTLKQSGKKIQCKLENRYFWWNGYKILCQEIDGYKEKEYNALEIVEKYVPYENTKLEVILTNKAMIKIQSIDRYELIKVRVGGEGLGHFLDNDTIAGLLALLFSYIISFAVLGRIMFGKWHFGFLKIQKYQHNKVIKE